VADGGESHNDLSRLFGLTNPAYLREDSVYTSFCLRELERTAARSPLVFVVVLDSACADELVHRRRRARHRRHRHRSDRDAALVT
jgi:hypothetical protein